MNSLFFIIFMIACSSNLALGAKIKRIDECRQIYSENEAIVSQNKAHKVVLDSDGNLNVISDACCNKDKKDIPIWSSETKGKGTGPRRLVLEPNGNLVIYDSKNVSVWNSGVSGTPVGPFSLNVSDDGILTVKEGTGKSMFSTFNTRVVRGVRYVKVVSGNRPENWLQISQLVVRNAEGVNVAKGKPFSSSLPYGSNSANFAVDGVEESRELGKIYHSAMIHNSFYEIDLETDTDVEFVEFYNRKDCCQQRILGAKILLMDSNFRVLRESEFTSADSKVVFGYILLKNRLSETSDTSKSSEVTILYNSLKLLSKMVTMSTSPEENLLPSALFMTLPTLVRLQVDWNP
jgi:hypothetical protein